MVSNSDEDSEQIVFIQQFKGNIMSSVDLILSFVGLAVGTGVTKNGAAFKNGWLTATIVSTIFAVLEGISLYLQFLAFLKTKTGTLEQCAFEILPNWGFRTYLIISLIPLLLVEYFYLTFCESSIISFFNKVYPDNHSQFLDPLVIDSLILIFVYIPVTISPKAKHFKHLARVKTLMIILLLIAVAIIFAGKVKAVGFDPNHESRAVVPNIESFTACISTFATAYLIQPISMPSISNLEKPSYKKIRWVIFVSCFVQWILNEIFGLLEYFTLYNINDGDVFFNYFHNSLADVANIVLSLMMILSLGTITFPTRNVLFNIIIPGIKKRNVGLWMYLAIIVYVSIMFVSRVNTPIGITCFAIILDVIAPISMLILPSMLYIIVFKKEVMHNYILSIVLIVIGAIVSLFFLYNHISSLMKMMKASG